MVDVSLQKTVTTMFIGDKNCLKAQLLLAVRKAVVMVGLRLELVRMFKPVMVGGVVVHVQSVKRMLTV